jgi:hypothetical protein
VSEMLPPTALFWVRTMRAQARRAAKAWTMEYEMGRWMEVRGRRKPGTEGWTYCDNVCRALGARASAYAALRDGNAQHARVLLDKARTHRPAADFAPFLGSHAR